MNKHNLARHSATIPPVHGSYRVAYLLMAGVLALVLYLSGSWFRPQVELAEAAPQQQTSGNWVERTWATEHKWFGNSADMSGNQTIGGAKLADYNGVSAIGTAYVYADDGTNWSREGQLLAGDGAGEDWFGQSVGIDGTFAVVGAYKDDDNGTDSGSAYIFTAANGTWSEQAKLVAGDGAANDRFGHAVAIDGTTVVVGAPEHDPGGVAEMGAAYVFTYDGSAWTQAAKLLAGDGDATDGFGYSVAIEGDTIVVGAYLSGDGSGWGDGAAYVFSYNGTGWVEEAKLLATRDTFYFGFDVAISGDTIAVGAERENGESCCFQSGAAYVFVDSGSGWTQQSRLVPADPGEAYYFGASVSVWNDVLVVGSPNNDTTANAAGAAYVFVRDNGTWTQVQKVQGSNNDAYDYFGTSVGVNGNSLTAGAYNRSTMYLFDNQGSSSLQADFVASPTGGPSPLAVSYSDSSTPAGAADQWQWDFGDGNISTAQHPVYTYTVPGTYTVTLTVTDTGTSQSDATSKSGYITVTNSAFTGTWQVITTTNTPPVSGEYAMAYDSARDVVVLYGGNGAGWPYENGTWEFDGGDWSEVTTTNRPSAVYGMAMAYDAGRGVVVLFGGSDSDDQELGETWEYDGTNWTQIVPTSSPSARIGTSVVYNGSHLYLFGGNDKITTYDDLWRYDGTAWTQVSPALSPPARTLSSMAYHVSEGEIYLFGGRGADGNGLADLWTFDPAAASWSQVSATGPVARYAHSLTYYPGATGLVLAGGAAAAGDTLLANTWHYQVGGGWTEGNNSAGTPTIAYHGAVYDESDQAVIILHDSTTWAYR